MYFANPLAIEHREKNIGKGETACKELRFCFCHDSTLKNKTLDTGARQSGARDLRSQTSAMGWDCTAGLLLSHKLFPEDAGPSPVISTLTRENKERNSQAWKKTTTHCH